VDDPRAETCQPPPVNTRSTDGVEIYYEVTGSADTALVFVAGWMGNVRWWDAQRDALATDYRVVTLDLAGHGRSGKRAEYSAQVYAADIVAVTRAVAAPRVILIGHSMSGAYVTLAAPQVAGLVEVILVDTLKNLDAMPKPEMIEGMFAAYRADFPTAVRTMLPTFLYAPGTPPAVRDRLERELLRATGDEAVQLLEPLYRCDVREAAKAVAVPVRGVDTDLHPHAAEINRKYFADYDHVTLEGFGHYPMLECPDAFTRALRSVLIA
jgi:pimeloyl-ACP methyl ester carboxylesterase